MNYYARRSFQALVTAWAVITLTFLMIKYLPGGPMEYLRAQMIQSGQTGSIDELAELYYKFNPNKPLWEQYIDYFASVMVGDLGESIFRGAPVSEMLVSTLPWTIFYGSISLIATYLLAIALGGVMAYNEGGKFDMTSTGVSMVLNSIPYYVVGMLLLSVLGFQYGIFPTDGKVSPGVTAGFNVEFFASAFHHAALLMASFVITTTGGVALAARGNSISILGSNYLRVGRLRGLSSNRLALRYVARNAVLPLYTQFMISMSYVFGGSTVLETVFRYNGAGKLIIDALRKRDMPVIMGAFLVLTIAIVIAIFIADLTYGMLDPRTKTEGEGSNGV